MSLRCLFLGALLAALASLACSSDPSAPDPDAPGGKNDIVGNKHVGEECTRDSWDFECSQDEGLVCVPDANGDGRGWNRFTCRQLGWGLCGEDADCESNEYCDGVEWSYNPLDCSDYHVVVPPCITRVGMCAKKGQ
jgi:hypothetical protein